LRQSGTQDRPRRGNPPRIRARWRIGAQAGVLLALAGCSPPESPPKATPAPGSAAVGEEVVEVETAPVRRGSILLRIAAPGTIEARRESQIGVEVQGRIERVYVDEGDRVEAGAPLFEIDAEPYRMALRQAQAALDLARAERAQVEADLTRVRALQKQNVVSPQQREKLETGLAVARSGEQQAAEMLALAQHKLDRTVVRAPYAASVVARLADEGTTALVQPQTVVLVLQESGELEAKATIPESKLALVRVGDPALIHVEGLAAPIQTEISAVGDAIDPATRTYAVRMRVPNPDRALKAGLFAEIEILPQSKRDALLVPRSALRSEAGSARVFTVRDGVAAAVPVTLGAVAESEAEILGGLRVDTPVIVGAAAEKVTSGMKVRVVPAATRAAAQDDGA
jgi:membrane fusion protein (multidrug efflux system)